MDVTGRIIGYFSENQTKLAVIAVVLIVIVTVAYGSISYFHQRGVKDSEALWKIVNSISVATESISENGEKDLILVKGELAKLKESAGESSVKKFSTYFIGVIDLRLGFYNDAVDTFLSLLSEEEESPLRFSVPMGLAYSYEGLSSYDMALTYFEKARDSALDSNGKGSAMYGVARCYELMGKIDEARNVYSEIIEKIPDYPDIGFIRIHLSSLS